jgi:thiol-disulfide isomerase/thioredoxin
MQAAEGFDEAMTIDVYLSRMRENREAFIRNIERTTVNDAERTVLGGEPLRILIFTEDWCQDSVQFVPMLAKLAQEVPGIEVRVLFRDEHRDLVSEYRAKDGRQAIPTFVFFDSEMREIGVLVERPAAATAEIAAETRRFQKAHPDLPGINRTVDRMPDETRRAVKANTREWRVDKQETWARYLFDEIAEIVQSASQDRVAWPTAGAGNICGPRSR